MMVRSTKRGATRTQGCNNRLATRMNISKMSARAPRSGNCEGACRYTRGTILANFCIENRKNKYNVLHGNPFVQMVYKFYSRVISKLGIYVQFFQFLPHLPKSCRVIWAA